MAKTAQAAPTAAPAASPKKPFSLKPVYWGLLLVYAVLVFYGISNHEPWRDEAQSWLLCRDLSLGGLLKTLPAEGHPPVWYLLVFPFAKLGAPYMTQNVLTALIMIAGVYLLLFRTSLPIYLKVALPFCYFFLYQYSVIARSYCLIVFFIALILALYPSRFRRPWPFALAVVGLANTEMMSFTFAAAIAGLYVLDAWQQKLLKGKVLAAFAVMCIGGAYLIPYMVLGSPTADSFAARIQDHTGELKKMVTNAFFPYSDARWGEGVFIIVLFCLLSRPKALFALLCGFAGLYYVLGYKYIGDVRHQGILMLITLGAVGLAYYYKEDKWNPKLFHFNAAQVAAIALTLSIVGQIKIGLESYSADNDEVFSDARGAAEYLMENNLEHATIVGHRSYVASAMLPFMPRDVRIWFAECGREGTFIQYDPCHMANLYLPHDYAAYVADTTFKRGQTKKDVVLVLSGPIQDPQLAQGYKLVYHTPQLPIVHDEEYFIF